MFQGTNYRLQDRFPVSDEEGLLGTLNTASAEAETRLVDLSLSGAALVIDQPHLLRQGGELNLGLRWHDRPVGITPVEPVHIREVGMGDSRSHVVGMRFQSTSEPFLQELCTFILHTHSQTPDRPRFVTETAAFNRLTDPKRIAGMFAYCVKNRVPLRLFELSGQPLGKVEVLGVKGVPPAEQALTCRIHLLGPGSARPGTHYYLVLQTLTSLYLMLCPFLEQNSEQGLFGIPGEVLEGGFRRLGRVWLDEHFPVTLEFVHPQIPGRFIRKVAREAGLGGMSFLLKVEEDLLVKGSVIPTAVIRLPDGHSLPVQCVVRHTLRENDGQFFGGIEFLDFAGNGRQIWVEELLKQMNPEVKQATPFTLDDVWEILDRSGYLAEKPAEQMKDLKMPFFDTWGRLLSERSGGRCWLFGIEDRPLATICVSRIYSDTWLIHQLACDMDRFTGPGSKLILPNLMVPRTAFQWIPGVHPRGEVLVYLDAAKPFNRWAWFDVLEANIGHPGLTLQTMSLASLPVDSLPDIQVCQDIWVRDAKQAELAQISEDLLQRDGAHLHKAFDYAAGSLNLDCMVDGLDHNVIGRKRRILVAGHGEHDSHVGYALLESGNKGVNVFALYETCRVVVQTDLPPTAQDMVRDALFLHIADHYRKLKIPSFLWLTGPGDCPPPDIPDMFMAQAVRGLFSVELIPRIITYLNNIWVHR
ncbi:MAG: PilZ domain-containing protein [Bradymonadales bacterium]|nr:PilZ domain-containing protein [Bradymonadales bacterium]